MTGKFYCKSCNVYFTTEGTKVEYNDPIYGPCASYRADCPECGEDCSEYVKPKPQKSEDNNIPSCGAAGGSCCGG